VIAPAPWLLLDVGNTAIKWRLADADGLREQNGVAATRASLCESVNTHEWKAVALSSVAGEVADTALLAALKAIRAVPVWQARAESSCLGLVSRYPEPARMGVDRWLAMLGARHANAGPLCVIDAGTAITLDLVAAQGRHEGGYILPGAELMRRALTADTDQIQVDALDAPTLAPGSDTRTCVSAGGWRAVTGAVQSVLADYPEHRAMLTGGLAPVLLEMGLAATHHPHLVMEGLRLWLLQTLDDQGS
jgi:type III pantothenate kinase